MGYDITEQDPRLDELSYFALAQAIEAQHGIPAPTEATEFARYLPQVVLSATVPITVFEPSA